MVFVKDYIPVRYLSIEDKPIEAFFFEHILHNKKWLVSCPYNPHRNNIARHLESVRGSLDLHSAHYENIILLVEFNISTNDTCMESFCNVNRFRSLIKNLTYF